MPDDTELIYILNGDDSGGGDDNGDDDGVGPDDGPIDDPTCYDDTPPDVNIDFTDPEIICVYVNQDSTSVQNACLTAFQATELLEGISMGIDLLGLIFPPLELAAGVGLGIEGVLGLLGHEFSDCAHDPPRTDTNVVTFFRPHPIQLQPSSIALMNAAQSVVSGGYQLAIALSVYTTTYERYETLRNSTTFGVPFASQLTALQQNAAECAQLCGAVAGNVGTISQVYQSASKTPPPAPKNLLVNRGPLTSSAAATQLQQAWQAGRGQIPSDYNISPAALQLIDQVVASSAKRIATVRKTVQLTPQAAASLVATKFASLQTCLNSNAQAFTQISNRILPYITRPAPEPVFSLAVAATASVMPGKSTTVAVETSVANGFSSAISLSVGGLLPGLTASLSPTTIASPGQGSATLTFSQLAAGAGGGTAKSGSDTCAVVVTAKGGGLVKSQTVMLTYSSNPVNEN